MWNLSFLLCLFPALTHTLLERQWAAASHSGAGRALFPSVEPLQMVVLVPRRPGFTYPDRHVYTSLHHTSRGPTVQAKTKLEGASQPGPALVVPVNLPCTAVMRVHG